MGPLNAFGRSTSRKAPFSPSSGAPSARSWVYPYNQHQAPAPTPQPVNVPSSVQEVLPLPNPYPRKDKHRALHVVNATRNDEDLDDDEVPQTNSLGMDFGYHTEPPPPNEPPKKKSILGRVFGGVGRTVFSSGKDSGSSSNRKLKRKATYDSDPTLTTYGGSISAQPNSQASTSFDDPGPSNLGPRLPHPTTTIPELPESEDAGSPPPDVVRLSDNAYPTQPHLNSVDTRGGPSHFVEGPMTESSHGHNLAERTTVMIYDSNPSQYPESRSHGQGHTPPVISRQASGRASPYVNPEPTPLVPLHPLRPSSFVPSVTRVPVPPIDLPSVAPTRRASLASPAAARSRQQSLNRGVPSQSPVARAGLQSPMDPPPPQPVTSAPTAADLQSPLSAHPLPADDYLKMTLSPASNEQTVTSGTTYSYDPSFSSDLSPLARFFKTLYRMPWIAHDRVTVDYHPDEGLLGSKPKKKKGKRMSTWYRSVLARSRRSSATIDLLGSVDDRKRRNIDVSLGAALVGLGSPFSSTRRRRGRRKENYMKPRRHRHRHHRDHHHSSSRDHHHHHSRHRHHESKRQTSSTDDDDDDDVTVDSALQRSPLMPAAMYPYAAYPSYPIAPGYAAYPLPPNESPPPPSSTVPTAARGMRSMTSTAPVYAAPTPQGYASYVTPAPVYLFQPAQGFDTHHHYQHAAGGASTANGSSVPPALVPGAVDTEHGMAGVPQGSASHAAAIPGSF